MRVSPSTYLRRAGRLAVLFFLISGFLFLYTGLASSHGDKSNKHDLEHLEKKPEGMIEFKDGAPAAPGEEYSAPTEAPAEMDHGSMENMDHGSMDHGDHGMGSDPFFKRGEHALSDLEAPKKDKSKMLLARGRNIYLHMCAFCHGKDGNGGGVAVDYLFPWPRNFRTGIFKFRSTPTGALPRDEDLYRTIVKGVPGTSMPAWGPALSPQDTWALVNLIKSFSSRFSAEAPGESIKISEPPAATPEILARGKALFTEQKCYRCHGNSGKGDGELSDSLLDAWKHAVFVHDVTNPMAFKSGSTPREIFRTLSTGLDGSPMESFSHIPEADRWALVHFVRSRFIKDWVKAETETNVNSYQVEFELSTEVDSPVWEGIKPVTLLLRPLSARRGGVETVNFTSVNNGEQIAIRLQWDDPTENQFTETRQDFFRDGAAVQFALGAVTLHTHGHNEPFFGMGNRGKPVNIWHWKAGLEETLEAENDLEYSTGGVDMDALIYGGLMSNPVARLNTTQENAVEELNAEGFGTITPQAEGEQTVEGSGEWKDGKWTVVFLRDLHSGRKWDVNLKDRKDSALMALAVWDGDKEDRNGRKVITVWQRLNVLKAPPPRAAAGP